MILTKITKVMMTGVLGVAMVATLNSCVDDHFDIPEGDGADGTGTETLWTIISSNPNLSNFARLAEKTPAFKDEKHIMEGYTFKDILNGGLVLTVFAPNNDALTATDVQEYEQLLETRPYDVYLRFVGNHVARNRYVATGMNPQGKAERIVFINNKKGIFDREAKTIKDVQLQEPNIPATNGVLHILGKQIPFAYNIYEYIRANKNYSHLNAWISRHDTLYFNADYSAVAGSDKETGEPIYVDSVYTRFNSLYYYSYQPNSIEWVMPHKGIYANIEQEDSIWAMVLPTDAAWEEAMEEMKPWYNYATTYFDMSKIDAFIQEDANDTRKKQMQLTVKDTLQEDAISMDLVSPLAFNVRMQRRIPEQTTYWTKETFLQYKDKIQKLFNTRTDTFTTETGHICDLLFDNQQPIEVSNGLIYSVDHWNFRKADKALDVEVDVRQSAIFQNVRYNLTSDQIKQKDESGKSAYTYMSHYETLSLDNNSELAQKYGKVSKGSFMRFYDTRGEPSKAAFKLVGNEADQQVLSGIEYEVGIVMVPYFYRTRQDPSQYPEDQQKELIKKNQFKVIISYLFSNNLVFVPQRSEYKSSNIDYSGEKVETLWVENKFTKAIKFPYSYRNLTKSYPTVSIELVYNKNLERRGYTPEFCIDEILLRPKQSTK